MKRRKFWFSTLIWLISNSLGLLFMYTAASKLMAYDKFVATIGQSAMLAPHAGLLAWLVPVLEIIIAVMLVFPRLRRLGLYASLTLMAVFTAYIFIVLHFMDKQPCACGGAIELLGWKAHLIFNIGFTLLAGIGIVLQKKFIGQLSREEAQKPGKIRVGKQYH